MEEKYDRARHPPGASFGPEQGAWSSPARGIAFGLALSAVLWVAIALVVGLLWEWWRAGSGLSQVGSEPPRATNP